MPEQTFIIELSKDSILLLGQLVHIYQKSQYAGPIGKKTLEQLILQTDCVLSDANKHFVYSQLGGPDSATKADFRASFVPQENGKPKKSARKK